MILRAVSFGFYPETPATSGPGIVLAQPGPPEYEDDAAILVVHGSVRAAAADIEVERTEILRSVQLVLVLGISQVPMSAPLAASAVIFPDDIEDISGDLVGSFCCEVVVPVRMGLFYFHAVFWHYVFNVVRVHLAGGVA